MVLRRFLHSFITLALICLTVLPHLAHADAVAFLPAPGTMVYLSSTFEPVLIKGLKVHPDNPFLFDFIVDSGNSQIKLNDPAFKAESAKLIKYFLSALTVPEKDLWVNLSPYEKDRMIAPNLGQTQMGQEMLAQDYLLKQLTASMIYPEKGLGKEFWDKVYAQVSTVAAASPITMDAFNKVWITADRADVYEGPSTRTNGLAQDKEGGFVAYVTSAHLKVMLEEDYLSTKEHAAVSDHRKGGSDITQTLKQIVLPAIEKEVNEGKNFAQLRQMYHSMILASWYKMRLKNALLTQVYGNRSKVGTTINAVEPKDKEAIFQRYLQAYKKGVFNFIKEEIDPKTYQTIPRKYFSGGLAMHADAVMRFVTSFDPATVATGEMAMVSSPLSIKSKKSVDHAQISILLVDDANEEDNVNLMIFKVNLEVSGLKVIRAKDGVEALRILAEQGGSIDVISTDFNMPNMDGGQLIKELHEKFPHIPVFLRTGHNEKDEPSVQHLVSQYGNEQENLKGVFDKVTDAHGNQLIKGVKQLFPKDAAQIAVAKVILLTTNAATADKESEVIARELGINSDEVYQALNMQEIKTMGKRDPNAVIIVNGHVNHTLEDPELSGFKIIIRSGQTVGFYEAGSKQIGYTFTRGKDTALKRAFDQLSDKAMNSDSVGGIDLNTGSINVSRNGSGIAMKFDQAMIDRIKRQGFLGIDFRIERIVPIPNLAAILGC